MIKHMLLALLLLGLMGVRTSALAQSKIGVVCIKGSKIAVRPACLAGEKVGKVSSFTKKGPPGNTGSAGPGGVPGREASFATSEFTSVPQTGVTKIQSCSPGKIAVGGGCSADNATVIVTRSFPSETSPGDWVCVFKPRRNSEVAGSFLTSFAMCLDS